MGIEKGKWVEGRYVDENGIEILPPVSERPKGYKPPPWLEREIGKNVTVTFSQYYSKFLKKVFTIPFLTMIGVWIIVYYQVTSHNHYINGGTYKSISGSVSVNR